MALSPAKTKSITIIDKSAVRNSISICVPPKKILFYYFQILIDPKIVIHTKIKRPLP
jgi:hypothetical protein